MLRDLVKQYNILHLGNREYHIRFSLNALLCLEMTYKPLSEILKTDWHNWSIEDILQLCHASMCDRSCNKKAVNARNFQAVKPTLAELGALIDVSQLEMLKFELITAISDSMPKSQSNDRQEENPLAELQLRAFYCDIMGRSESELFSSTYKEINDRTENYLIAKGLKKPPAIVQMLDD